MREGRREFINKNPGNSKRCHSLSLSLCLYHSLFLSLIPSHIRTQYCSYSLSLSLSSLSSFCFPAPETVLDFAACTNERKNEMERAEARKCKQICSLQASKPREKIVPVLCTKNIYGQSREFSCTRRKTRGDNFFLLKIDRNIGNLRYIRNWPQG